MRSASPSNATPRSHPCLRTAACKSTMFSGSIGLAGWFGKLPSSSKYSGTTSHGSDLKTCGTVSPAMPLPASIGDAKRFDLRDVDERKAVLRRNRRGRRAARSSPRRAPAGGRSPESSRSRIVARPVSSEIASARAPRELHAVVLRRVVRGRDHDAPVVRRTCRPQSRARRSRPCRCRRRRRRLRPRRAQRLRRAARPTGACRARRRRSMGDAPASRSERAASTKQRPMP